MSSIVIAGDTSGSVTLQAPAVSGTTVLTLPATSGTIVTSASGTAATATNLAGGSNGTIPYQSASGTTQMLAVGSPGQLLQTNGAGAPTWVTPSSGALVFLSSVTASSSATVDIDTTFDSTYDNYMIVASGITCATSGNLQGRFRQNGSYTSGSYDYHVTNQVDSSTAYSGLAAESVTNFITLYNLDNGASSTGNFVMYVYHAASTTLKKQATWTGAVNRVNASSSVFLDTGACGAGSAAVTGVRFSMASGNVNAGTFRLYGIVNS